MTIKYAIPIIAALTLSACAEKSLYYWGNYNGQLLSYYKNPGEQEKFASKLLEIIKKSEEKNQVPPGLYAEYGYMMLQAGSSEEATIYFAKERDKWPESNILMTRLIDRLGKVQGAAATTTTE